MKTELNDFIHFRDVQLHSFDLDTGILNTKFHEGRSGALIVRKDVGSINPDGYIRVWCNGTLRMKHRLVYFLAHGALPAEGEEIDHIDRNRSNNSKGNLRILTKSENNTRSQNRKFGKQLTFEQVQTICELLQNTNESDQTIADVVGRTRATVRDIKKRRSRTAISKDYSWPHRE